MKDEYGFEIQNGHTIRVAYTGVRGAGMTLCATLNATWILHDMLDTYFPCPVNKNERFLRDLINQTRKMETTPLYVYNPPRYWGTYDKRHAPIINKRVASD